MNSRFKLYEDVKTLLDWLDDHADEIQAAKADKARILVGQVWILLERRKGEERRSS